MDAGTALDRTVAHCMMRLLWVKAGKLLPVDTGGKIRSFNIMRHLATRHELTVLSYYHGVPDEQYEEDLRREFPGAAVVAVTERSGAVPQALHYARRFPRVAPYSVSKFTSPQVRERLAQIINERNPHVTVCDFLAASLNFPRRPITPSVLFQHNVESALWQRQARHEGNIAKRLVFTLEAAKMRRYETAALGRFQHVIAVSDHDRALMARMSPGTAITVVPTGVDVAYYRRDDAERSSRPLVMFLGSMDWPANIDGVEYFCANIWPEVVARVPDAMFEVVGRHPPLRIRRLGSDSVKIVGGVTSVVPHLHSASVFVVPLRIGGGTRLKIYEAMAAALPIVSTRVGAEGLDVTNGQDIVIEDDPHEFAEALIGLLQSNAQRRMIGDAAATTAARFDWSVITTAFESVLERVMAE